VVEVKNGLSGMEGAVRHLHASGGAGELTPEEWLAGIAFLTFRGRSRTQTADRGLTEEEQVRPKEILKD